jgi:hypothetical protein
VDEIQDAKGHKYLTLLYQIDQGFTRLLWVGKERTLESFQGFFTMIGEQLDHECVFARESRHERKGVGKGLAGGHAIPPLPSERYFACFLGVAMSRDCRGAFKMRPHFA